MSFAGANPNIFSNIYLPFYLRKKRHQLTRNKFFKLGRLRPAVVVSLFPLSSKVCSLCRAVGSIPTAAGMLLSTGHISIDTRYHNTNNSGRLYQNIQPKIWCTEVNLLLQYFLKLSIAIWKQLMAVLQWIHRTLNHLTQKWR